MLLLDEPTNDLDVDMRALEEALEDFAGCAVIISHDRWFLDRIATHILPSRGDQPCRWFEGNFQDYEEDKKRRLGSIPPSRTGSSTRSFAVTRQASAVARMERSEIRVQPRHIAPPLPHSASLHAGYGEAQQAAAPCSHHAHH